MSITVPHKFDPDELLQILNGNIEAPGSLLKIYVDRWIASGITAQGIDSPTQRNFRRSTPLIPGMDETANPRELENSFRLFFKLHEPHVSFPEGAVVPVIEYRPRAVRGFEADQQRVTRIVVGLFSSEYKFRIARCGYSKCGRYFYLRPGKQKRTFVAGPYCDDKCCRRAKAVRSTKANRIRLTATMIAEGAAHLKKNPQLLKESDKAKVRDHLNDFLDKHVDLKRWRPGGIYGNGIHVNWVTWHWAEMIKAAEE